MSNCRNIEKKGVELVRRCYDSNRPNDDILAESIFILTTVHKHKLSVSKERIEQRCKYNTEDGRTRQLFLGLGMPAPVVESCMLRGNKGVKMTGSGRVSRVKTLV